MSDKSVADLTLERVNRLTEAVADLMESHAAQGRNVGRLHELQGQQLGRIEASLSTLASDVRGLASSVREMPA